MQKISDIKTGTSLSRTGSENRLSGETSDPAQNSVTTRPNQAGLPSTKPDPARDAKIAEAIRGPISAMTTLHMQPEKDRKSGWQFWIDSLRPYPAEWVADAFRYFARNSGGQYPNPQRIIEIINKRRGG